MVCGGRYRKRCQVRKDDRRSTGARRANGGRVEDQGPYLGAIDEAYWTICIGNLCEGVLMAPFLTRQVDRSMTVDTTLKWPTAVAKKPAVILIYRRATFIPSARLLTWGRQREILLQSNGITEACLGSLA